MSPEPDRKLIVAIDGPAGAGKSTIARLLAQKLGYTYIDTGAMYRSVGFLARERGVALDDAPQLAELTAGLRVEFPWIDGVMHTIIGGRDLSTVIRSQQASMDASTVSQVGAVRAELVALQRRMGADGGVVMEGRDIGTVVFPEAELKVFLSASSRVRGKRRWAQLKGGADEQELESIIAEVRRRDLKDSTRDISPLRPAADAVILDSSQLGIDRVLRSILRMVHARLEGLDLPPASVADSPVPMVDG